MDFSLSDEQRMLADLVGRFVERKYPFEKRRALAGSKLGWSQDNWAALVDMGLVGLHVPEDYGGMAASAAETMIVMEAFGRGLVLEPYLSTAVVGAKLIARGGSAFQRQAWLPPIAEGSKKTALATLEPLARFDLSDIATTARQGAGRYVLDGRKSVVLHGDCADLLLVSARTSGTRTDPSGVSLFLVDAHAPGVTIKGFPSLDGQRVAEVTLRDVEVGEQALLGARDQGYALLEWTVDQGLFALCAESVGVMSKLCDITYDYLRTRKQFGKPIGAFQALQHRAADMLAALEQARSMVYFAASRIDDENPRERRRALSAAKAMIGRSCRYIGQQAIQLHGGMGMTEELAVGWYVKRLTCIDMTWGNTEHHVELFAEFV